MFRKYMTDNQTEAMCSNIHLAYFNFRDSKFTSGAFCQSAYLETLKQITTNICNDRFSQQQLCGLELKPKQDSGILARRTRGGGVRINSNC